MKRLYGIQGTIINFPFQDFQETFHNKDGIEIEIKAGSLVVGVD